MEAAIESAARETDAASRPFEGRWHGLVSTTNWEKGRIICDWREALRAAGAAPHEYSDDAWSRRVGYVSGQHVGRLRRVHERFNTIRTQFSGLYWSHFQAAVEWTDAEMWLEGAVQNGWSVSQLRKVRWETLGGKPSERPFDREIVVADWDEDAPDEEESTPANRASPTADAASRSSQSDGIDFQGDRDEEPLGESITIDPESSGYPVIAPDEPIAPFAELAELPSDLAEAFEAFKLSALRHKLNGWREIRREDVLACIEALRQLVLAPA